MSEFPLIIGFVAYMAFSIAFLWLSYREAHKKQEAQCANHDRATWQQEEEEMNKRMDIIGQNGNTGEHYDEETH